MSALTLTVKSLPKARLNFAGVSSYVTEFGVHNLGRQLVRAGTEQYALGDLFDIQGQEASHWVLVGDLSTVDGLGAGLKEGVRVLVEGHVGGYLGQGLVGAQIRVMGNAGHGVGLAMRKGLIEIAGDAGDFVGGALPGAMQGMAGGEIVVHGSVGARCGDRMRRGAIVVAGDVGDYAGSRMLAGSIMALGHMGAHAGYSMKRGTLLVQGDIRLDCTFADCGEHTLPIVNLLYRHWSEFGGTFAGLAERRPKIHRYLGDRAIDGKGEILRMV